MAWANGCFQNDDYAGHHVAGYSYLRMFFENFILKMSSGVSRHS
ncbi:hypothetical protein IYO1511_c27510 [Lactiplantibacillus plantarum]|nr:hypothetical protein IYO1511_c27510 [Lactiplantibacillus plantarum]